MDSYLDRIRVLAPHYVAMLVLIIVAVALLDTVGPDVGRPVRFVVVAFVALGYVVVLRILGLAPEPWA